MWISVCVCICGDNERCSKHWFYFNKIQILLSYFELWTTCGGVFSVTVVAGTTPTPPTTTTETTTTTMVMMTTIPPSSIKDEEEFKFIKKMLENEYKWMDGWMNKQRISKTFNEVSAKMESTVVTLLYLATFFTSVLLQPMSQIPRHCVSIFYRLKWAIEWNGMSEF